MVGHPRLVITIDMSSSVFDFEATEGLRAVLDSITDEQLSEALMSGEEVMRDSNLNLLGLIEYKHERRS